MRSFVFTDWSSFLSTLIGLALFTLIGIGIRLLVQVTVQQRRERLNRQINERLRTLISAYRTLGGSFTGELGVSGLHLRDMARSAEDIDASLRAESSSERSRRIRDAVEAALSDIILLGTREQVELASRAVQELVAGRTVHVHDLVVSLRNFIREALDLEPLDANLVIPSQGPTRPQGSGGRAGRGGTGRGEAQDRDGNDRSGRGGGSGGAALGAGAGGAGLGLGVGLGAETAAQDDDAGSTGSGPAHRS